MFKPCKTPGSKETRQVAGERILIVDDDFAHALLCQRLLELAGFQVKAVNNSQEALVELHGAAIDLLITDIRMPDMDGFELMEVAARADPELAILLMTGFGTVENAVQALRFGADGLLLKPLSNADELVETVRSVLHKRQNKLDAMRLKTLHPLFNIGERLFSETAPDILGGLIVNDIRQQTGSSVTGILMDDGSQAHWTTLAGTDLIQHQLVDGQSRADRTLSKIAIDGQPVLLEQDDERLGVLREWMQQNKFRDVVAVPVKRVNKSFVFYTFRRVGQPDWTNPDMELVVIFARQAAIALENAQLYDDLKKYTRQLEDSQRSLILAEKMAALGRLMASLAHELNNPLQSVQNCLHLAARTDLPEGQRQEFINLANQQIKRVSGLAQTAMEYYRPDRLVRKRIEILGLVESVLDLIAPQLASHQISVERMFPDHPIDIEIIHDNIQQVILNVLLNGMDAVLEHDIERKIWVEIQELEHEIEISIEDNGCGIPPEIEERLFEPFNSTKPNGTGLGLSISYELVVDVHGGELGFVPPLHGSGARARIVLPWKE